MLLSSSLIFSHTDMVCWVTRLVMSVQNLLPAHQKGDFSLWRGELCKCERSLPSAILLCKVPAGRTKLLVAMSIISCRCGDETSLRPQRLIWKMDQFTSGFSWNKISGQRMRQVRKPETIQRGEDGYKVIPKVFPCIFPVPVSTSSLLFSIWMMKLPIFPVY